PLLGVAHRPTPGSQPLSRTCCADCSRLASSACSSRSSSRSRSLNRGLSRSFGGNATAGSFTLVGAFTPSGVIVVCSESEACSAGLSAAMAARNASCSAADISVVCSAGVSGGTVSSVDPDEGSAVAVWLADFFADASACGQNSSPGSRSLSPVDSTTSTCGICVVHGRSTCWPVDSDCSDELADDCGQLVSSVGWAGGSGVCAAGSSLGCSGSGGVGHSAVSVRASGSGSAGTLDSYDGSVAASYDAGSAADSRADSVADSYDAASVADSRDADSNDSRDDR